MNDKTHVSNVNIQRRREKKGHDTLGQQEIVRMNRVGAFKYDRNSSIYKTSAKFTFFLHILLYHCCPFLLYFFISDA